MFLIDLCRAHRVLGLTIGGFNVVYSFELLRLLLDARPVTAVPLSAQHKGIVEFVVL